MFTCIILILKNDKKIGEKSYFVECKQLSSFCCLKKLAFAKIVIKKSWNLNVEKGREKISNLNWFKTGVFELFIDNTAIILIRF